MITTHIMGGLGNQLFQIFTLISTSITSKIPFYFEYVERPDRNDRPFYWSNMLNKLSIFLKKDIKIDIILREPHFHYADIPYNGYSDLNIKLFGYYQSYKYFDQNKSYICRMIGLNDIKNNIRTKFNDSFFINTVSLHFRIGDYANIQHYHPILNLKFYKNALNKLVTDTDNDNWNILCFFEKENELEIDKKIHLLQNDFKTLNFLKIDNTLTDWEQLVSMSLCCHNIIANSTFSWWGAYLNDNENNVYYSRTWFGPAHVDKITDDMFPQRWKVIETH